MTQASVVSTRLFLWSAACDAVDLYPTPPFTAAGLSEQAAGEISFRAERPTLVDGQPERLALTVLESWEPGSDPLDDRRLESQGCWLRLARWHLQVGTGAANAQRLDVIPMPDAGHSRIHSHPYGQPNDVRVPAELPPPRVWLSGLLDDLEPAASDLYARWDPDAEE